MLLDADVFQHLVNGVLQPSTGSWSQTNLWWDLNLNNGNGGPALAPPGAGDTATIPVGGSCTVTSGASAEAVTVQGSMLVESTLSIDGNPNMGLGFFSVNGGSATVGGPGGTSGGTIDTISLGISTNPQTGSLGSLAIGDPRDGMSGVVDVSQGMTNAGTLTVGGAGGSSGVLDVYSLTAGGPTINANGTIEVKHDANFMGTTTIAGGVIKADNIDANDGASVTIGGGGATVTSGPLSGNLTAEINASFTLTGPVTLGTGATLGDGKFFIDGPLTVDEPLTVENAEFDLQDDGSTTFGSIGGSGSIDFSNHEFDWEGGTIGGLTGGGFTIEGQADFSTSGSNPKTLATTLTNIGPSTVDFEGPGSLTIAGPGSPAGTGALINEASAVIPMELSEDLSGGGTFTNAGYLNIVMTSGGPSSVIITAPLDNTPAGVIDDELGAGTLTLDDTSAGSILDGSIDLHSNGLAILGLYTTDSSLSVDDSGATTVSGTLTIASEASADIDALSLSSGGTITGAGDLTIDGDCYWTSGTISGSGSFTVGGAGTLYVTGSGTLSRNLDVEGTVEWESSGVSIASGAVIDIEESGYFNYEISHDSMPTLNNDGTLEIGAGDVLMPTTFTQSSSGKLQIDIASDNPYGYGFLDVSGSATLDGTLDGNLENGYQPTSGTAFDVLNFGSSSGQFATVDPQGWTADYNPTSVDLVAG
ncbi:MAG TPA: hypothetical protein VE999_05090 [Gemmataceae bacterium]|nr:hypothetical protein [Gemmataceae bacterium]